MRWLGTRIKHVVRHVASERGEDGAVLALVAIGIVVLLGSLAMSVDAGRMYNEKRELQNGADAAALAVATDCASGDCGSVAQQYGTAEQYADANASDSLAWVDDVTIDLDAQTVRVHASTEDPGGDNHFDMLFAQIVGFNGLTVGAEATVAWGAPLNRATLPLIFSTCEWERFTGQVPGYDDIRISWSDWPNEAALPGALPSQKRATVYIHGKEPSEEGLSPCHDSPSGADLPGGFGWLETASGCESLIDENDIVVDDPGASASTGCSSGYLASLVGTIVLIPYFEKFEGLGSNGQYTVAGFGAMYLTGYNFGGQFKEASIAPGSTGLPCDGEDRCVEGYFIKDYVAPGGGEIGGQDFGVVVINFTG